jgi:23S rRNA (guanosine2251-2'-O)-methyltransferase
MAAGLKKTMDELDRVSSEKYKTLRKNPVIVVLDNVRSAHNVGSVFRTCDAFLVEKVYLCGITPVPPLPEIHKTALGASEHVEWEYQHDTIQLIKKLKNSDCNIYAVEQTHGSIMLSDVHQSDGKTSVLLFGNEVYGIEQKVLDICHETIEIPQMGTKHSLNVSVCAGIAIYHFTIDEKNK